MRTPDTNQALSNAFHCSPATMFCHPYLSTSGLNHSLTRSL